jgi:4'-phosphopantetheinyl transferase EntD
VTVIDPVLERDMASLVLPGLLVGHRLIAAGDENALLDAEAASCGASVIARRRASGAARIVARGLMARLGVENGLVPKDASGAPIWPAGIVGSLAHDDTIAVAAVARARDFRAIGIDVEPAEPLPTDMLDLVAAPSELRGLAEQPLHARILFAAKEAVYKASFPLDRVFLEFRDITVDLADRSAVARERAFALRICVSNHIVVLAVI